MSDQTETIRRQQVAEINSDPGCTSESRSKAWRRIRHIRIAGSIQCAWLSIAPYVFVQRKSDLTKGSMLFQHSPRFYFGFKPE